MLTYPASELQSAEHLLQVLGSFWAETFAGGFTVGSLALARAQRDAQHHLNLLELVASMSRFNVPVFHTENWYFLVLKESERDLAPVNLPKYDGTYVYDEATGLRYGDTLSDSYDSWTAPAALVSAGCICNRITDAGVTLVNGIDFQLVDGSVRFRSNPFDNSAFAIRSLFSGNDVVDREVGLWVYRGSFDLDTVYEQFGYAIGLAGSSSEGYKSLVNAVYDGLVEGTSVRAVQQAWSAICGVPLVKDDVEVVEQVLVRVDDLLVVTDRNAYSFHPESTPLVAVGDALLAGDALTDTLQFFEFNRGEVPSALTALVCGRGLLASGYMSELVFENKTVPLVVEEDVDGYTRVSFELGGLATDAEAFWDNVHAAGVAKGETLAHLLDQRPTPDGEPTAVALPATVNPLEFLVSNVLRSNAYAVRVRPHTFGPDALGLGSDLVMRKLVPPHTLGLVLVELVLGPDKVTMEGQGDELVPGYTEGLTFLPITPDAVEVMAGTDFVSERVVFKQVRGKCE